MNDYTLGEGASLFEDDPALETGNPPIPLDNEPEKEAIANDTEVVDNDAQPDQAPDEVGEGDPEDEGDQDEPEAVIDPPANWTQEAKELFASASPELKQAILANEAAQTAAATKAQMEAANLRKENAVIAQFTQKVADFAKRSESYFDGKWAGVTQEHWDNLAYENPEEHKRLRAEYVAESQALEEALARREEAEELARIRWADEQSAELKAAIPELSQKENVEKLVTFATEQGLTAEELNGLNAKGFKVLHRLMKAEEELKALKAAKTAPQTETQTKTQVKPSLKSNGVKAPQPNQYTRFNQTLSREDAGVLFT